MTLNMKSQTSYIFLAPGFEEIEALATADAMRRAGMKVVEVAVAETKNVTGATGQTVVADSLIGDIDMSDAEWIITPGGQPGADNLHVSSRVNAIIKSHWDGGGKIASICAGPAVVLITSEGPGTTLQFAKAVIAASLGEQTADKVGDSMLAEAL